MALDPLPMDSQFYPTFHTINTLCDGMSSGNVLPNKGSLFTRRLRTIFTSKRSFIRLAASRVSVMQRSGVRPSVCPSVCPIIFLTLIERAAHTQRDTPGGSTRRGPTIGRTDSLVSCYLDVCFGPTHLHFVVVTFSLAPLDLRDNVVVFGAENFAPETDVFDRMRLDECPQG